MQTLDQPDIHLHKPAFPDISELTSIIFIQWALIIFLLLLKNGNFNIIIVNRNAFQNAIIYYFSVCVCVCKT